MTGTPRRSSVLQPFALGISPFLQVLGLPAAVVPLLIAIDALPDIFVTVANVTADLAVTTIVARLLGHSQSATAPGAAAAA